MTKEEVEEASGRDRDDCFKDKGCPKLSHVVRWSMKNCKRNGVNLANSMKGTKLDKNEITGTTFLCHQEVRNASTKCVTEK